jgi:hypothetical protein
VAADAAGVVDEGDELGPDVAGATADVRAVHRVGLPEVVGVCLGEGEPFLVLGLGLRLEQLAFSRCAGRCGGNLLSLEQAALDAGPVDGRHVRGR